MQFIISVEYIYFFFLYNSQKHTSMTLKNKTNNGRKEQKKITQMVRYF